MDIGILISGLDDGMAPSLSTFDLDVVFDPALFDFDSLTFGDPILGDQLDLFGFGIITSVSSGIGMVNFFEVSLDFPFDLDDLQPGSFTLATLTFDALTAGTGDFDITIQSLGDSFGLPLNATVTRGTVTSSNATSVPEPGTLTLILTSLTGLIVLGRLRRRMYR